MTNDDDLDVSAIIEEIANRIMAEVQGRGGVKPLTPKQARAHQQRKDKAMAALRDTQASNALKLQKAQRKLSEL